MRYYLNFTIAAISLIGGIAACINTLLTNSNWELVLLAAVFFSFSTANITLLEIRDVVRAAADRERIKDEALADEETIVLRVSPDPDEEELRQIPSKALM